MNIMGGNGQATATVTLPPVSSRSLRHQDLPASQIACKLAQVLEHERGYIPTAKELAAFHKVSESCIAAARRLSPEERAARAEGRIASSLSQLLAAPEPVFRLPAPASVQSEPASNGSTAALAAAEPTLPATMRMLTTRW